MKRLVLTVVGLLALFSILRAHSQEETRRLVVHPSLIDLADDDSGLTIGLGAVEATGDRNQVWNVFPIRVSLRSGKERLTVSLSGLDVLARRGLSIGRPLSIAGTHRGDVVSVGGDVVVTGVVEGSVWVFGADAILRSGADVEGDAVALGGRVIAERGAVLGGNKESLPAIRIPFLGFLTSRQSADSLALIIELFGVALTVLALFLVLHFRAGYLSRQAAIVSSAWKSNLLSLFLAAVLAPVLVACLVVSVVGLLLVPVLVVALALVTYVGFLGVSVRLGRVFLRGDEEPLRLFAAGLVGLALIRGPAIAGRVLSIFGSDMFLAVGALLEAVSGIALFLSLLYGLGSGLTAAREPSR
jgi:hypothetical protein